MPSIQLRTDPGQVDSGAQLLLDWFEDRSASTVQHDATFLGSLVPSPVAIDFLHLAGAVFCADKLVARADTPDSWTRDISIQVPVADVSVWEGVAGLLESALSFLSGDRWVFEFVPDTREPVTAETIVPEYDAVSLFSGGLDSLAGVIAALESGKRLTLVGHHDSSLTVNKQDELYRCLRSHYGEGRVSLRKLFLRPAAPGSGQSRPLPKARENTTRSRSLLFLAAGIAIADGLGPELPLLIPENGFIGINVPLTAARAGSLSTRTTHPLFLDQMGSILEGLGLAHPIENPYRLMTKGEALAASPNAGLLAELAPRSVSCSHPETPRWRNRPQGNCGYCYPCLIRRASLYRIGSDRGADYAWDALTEDELFRSDIQSGASLRGLVLSLASPESSTDVLRNGRVPAGEARQFFEVYRRGRAELRNWLESGAGRELKRRMESA